MPRPPCSAGQEPPRGDVSEALRRSAELESRSVQDDIARQAVRDYFERDGKRELLDRVLDRELPRFAQALERLGQ
ncbi:hypothetical protein SAMN05660657_02324 [Geodermatophilus amargosae]|uniref:Uncharacterized protein n=1 Tax=Geodermatophilus amargosae TaxID=1296565 RepID=A0A1I6ZX83_9ACTN|nr:hypothetical protein [Geodermatophilus amargosae]SFT67299.1 hypothetical protein SAMN05660657_02324 [Geodermatophilus amargosae]